MSHTYTPAPATPQALAHSTAQEPANAPEPPARGSTCVTENGQLHLKLGSHIFCLWVHVSNPCTHGIVQQAPPVSPTKWQSH
ncbi:hypothetical protein O181_014750 [Austropuccinia psidii MF-1]|uniref:Uncharacterized protein n=1 Tax=Austropuccinia psidii MF-1 TaxID=1389203 RepID=A0A9Q3C2G7_9BASI|nr:hypothetical protein [Austropuccinia psidii MF-1]